MTLNQVYKQFPSEKDCIALLEDVFWGGKPKCPYCKVVGNFSNLKEEKRYHCNSCNMSFSVTVRTIFHKTKCDIQKWFYLINLVFSGQADIPVRKLGEMLDVTKDTASRMLKKVRTEKDKLTTLAQTISKFTTHE